MPNPPQQNYKAISVTLGPVVISAGHPVRLQSMTTTDTLDIAASEAQTRQLHEAGAEIVRLTAQGARQVKALGELKKRLQASGTDIPLVADIHFSTHAAELAAHHVDKVRINPGNYAEKRASFQQTDYTDTRWAQQLEATAQRLRPLLGICKEHGTAIRIGANHGSLSDRIMGRYGDTPEGLVESVMEFVRICERHAFYDIVISLKSSNTRVMVEANRLMRKRMQANGRVYPLHLGVTEAGDGREGRVRSAVGIGALLADGIGETIRVSLAEDPVRELPVAKYLKQYAAQYAQAPDLRVRDSFDPFRYARRGHRNFPTLPHNHAPAVLDLSQWDKLPEGETLQLLQQEPAVDALYTGHHVPGQTLCGQTPCLVHETVWDETPGTYPLCTPQTAKNYLGKTQACYIAVAQAQELDTIQETLAHPSVVLVYKPQGSLYQRRRLFEALKQKNSQVPVLLAFAYDMPAEEALLTYASADAGSLLIDGLGDGLMLGLPQHTKLETGQHLLFDILQASRQRLTKTEFIACPSCGRTQFDIQTTLAHVKAATAHLKGLKIAVMGCIVNGPGEMADADYGYVGAAPGKIALYKGKTRIKANVPQAQAVDQLIRLIQANGDWLPE